MNDQQRKELNQMKVQVQKLSTEHLKAEQVAFGLGEKVGNAENQMGFKQILKKK